MRSARHVVEKCAENQRKSRADKPGPVHVSLLTLLMISKVLTDFFLSNHSITNRFFDTLNRCFLFCNWW